MLLFQPFAKITFEREIWNVIDVIVALLLFGNVVWERVKGGSTAVAPPPAIQMSSAHGYDVFVSYSTKDYYDVFGNPSPKHPKNQQIFRGPRQRRERLRIRHKVSIGI